MTPEQKTAILQLRSEGLGYKKIAEKLQLKDNTVKSFLRRNMSVCSNTSVCSNMSVSGNANTAPVPARIIPTVQESTPLEPPAQEPIPLEPSSPESTPPEPPAQKPPVCDSAPVKPFFLRAMKYTPLPVEDTCASPKPRYTQKKDQSSRLTPCRNCKTPVLQTSGRKEKKYCSDACRIQWWNRNKYKIPRKTVHAFRCSTCGREFFSYGNTKRKYCSRDCYFSGRFHGGEKIAQE